MTRLDTFEINCAPHNYYSHLSTLHSLHLCAVIPNVRICEIDIDDVPWKRPKAGPAFRLRCTPGSPPAQPRRPCH